MMTSARSSDLDARERERRSSEMNTQQTMITTIPFQQKDAGASEAIKLFALYLQGITVVQVTR
ncbi:MAG: hypothetical protein IH877_09795 [Gemmatimonadetes bacterium]|nr:hypothetical protein [Gemmatimonadota bacterium]